MMKKTGWRTLSVWILCLAMVLSVSSCSKKDSTHNDADTSEQTDDTTKESSANTLSKDRPQAGRLPLTEETETFSFWIVRDYPYLEDINEMSSIQELEDRTNVHIEWQQVGSTEATEKFGILLASGDIPDMVYLSSGVTYPGGLETAVQDGIFLDTTDLIDNYMPNYKAWLNLEPALDKGTKTDSGNRVAIYTLNGGNTGMKPEMVWDGILVRKDWLDELGLEVPETIEEWHTALVGFRDTFGAEAPLMIGSDGTQAFGAFATAYGILPEWYQVNGQVKFGPAEEGYKEYVQMLRDWYAEGLIDPNFMTNDASIVASNDYIGTGKAGAGCSLWGYAADLLKTDYHMNEEDGFYLTGAKNPVLNKGDQSYTGYTGNAIGSPICISAKCSNPELACCWLDYLYTMEGMILNQYGMEGLTYSNDSGNYRFTDWIIKGDNDLGIIGSDAYHYHCLGTSSFGWYNWEKFFALNAENMEAIECSQMVWAQDSTDWVIPAQVSMTEQEGNEYNSYYTNISTIVDEQTVKYIMGTESMDTWDSFLESMRSSGLNRCMEIKQAAMDRYNAR